MGLIETFFNLEVLKQCAMVLLQGLQLTVFLGFTSLLLSFAIGLVLVLVRLYAAKPFRFLAAAYIDVFRAIPLLVLLVLIYYALPFLGINLSPFWAATSALSLVAAAYAAECFRAGIEAVARGQFEAAKALGFSWKDMMKDVVLPQALKLVVPPSTGIGISLIKDTALASVVAMPDLLKQASQAQAFYANPSPLIGAAVLYLVILLPLVRVVSAIEAKQQRAGSR
ncbi:amino acid ABC transporter permease [Pseudomonas kermanshahensis]|uniref:amino acid ABC transporter permease n=1 Tax=Pseudomonas kermanshahensis TaxID=2745482 RepID=UPI0023DB8B61|nr:amino acid ABC transporter permease [Pseudomonas kermanshahensis]WEL57544.1 amino acid ABC transporter permease [Pseudomonas kermanshahensis]